MGSISVVYDTNVLVSGIGFKGKPWRCLLLVFLGEVELVTSDEAIDEFQRVMGYDRLPFTQAEQETFPQLLRAESTVIEPTIEIEAIDDDPDDDKFLECAVEADVDYLVSGDPHLKRLEEYDGIVILEPAAFLDRVV